MEHQLRNNTVYIWQISFDFFYNRLDKIKLILSEQEIKRAEQFYFEKDKNRFIIHRGFLRTILGNYLNIEPYKIKFEYQKLGKPFIDTTPQIFFNSSHSNNIGLFAISKAGDIGVDVEFIRPLTDINLLTKRFFAREEYQLIFSLPEKEGLEKFFEMWTLKEAFLKATGEGIGSGLKDVSVSFDKHKNPILFYKKNKLPALKWTIQCLKLREDYYGAAVIKADEVETIFLNADFSPLLRLQAFN